MLVPTTFIAKSPPGAGASIMQMLPYQQVRQVQGGMLRMYWVGLRFELFIRESSRMRAIIWDILGTFDNYEK